VVTLGTALNTLGMNKCYFQPVHSNKMETVHERTALTIIH